MSSEIQVEQLTSHFLQRYVSVSQKNPSLQAHSPLVSAESSKQSVHLLGSDPEHSLQVGEHYEQTK